MKFPNLFIELKNGVKIAAEDALHVLADVEKQVPAAAAGLAVVIGTVDKALNDALAVTNNPAQVLSIQFDTATLADLKAVWPAVKAEVAKLGVKL